MEAEDQKKVVCTVNMRPRIEGKPVLIEAGTPFDGALIDPETSAELRKQGVLTDYTGPVPVDTSKLTAKQARDMAEQAAEELVKEVVEDQEEAEQAAEEQADEEAEEPVKKDAPKGIFAESIEDLQEFSVEELDALHSEICQKHDLPAPEPFKTPEEGIAKLSGKTIEEVLEVLTSVEE